MTNFGDHAHAIRAAFIRSGAGLGPSESLDAKRAALRERMHLEGKAFLSEETEAKRHGWKLFDPRNGWKN